MLSWTIKKIFGTSHDRTIRRLQPRVAAIGAMEKEFQALSDAELKAKTADFKQQIENGASLDDILTPAFAVCREASHRILNMRHYDVQLIGGMVLHEGKIAEMRTGEGKTLVATLPCYLNALQGKGVHVITVNDYLARRDAEWMGRLYGWLGLSTGVVVGQQEDEEKRKAYRSDITYGQNNEFGFDYLRDNMKSSALDYQQRPLHYAIVDEVDSILIDEARTPLIISGQGEQSSDKYKIINEMIPKLRNEQHYVVDEKGHSVTLTDEGVELSESLLTKGGVLTGSSKKGHGNLYDTVNLETLHIVNQCLRAHTLFKRDVNYMVREQKIMIIDEFTGRVLAGRRWSDGLHQAVEAKENVPIQEENRTMATVTFQNLFRIYKKIAGMTGTADTEASEFHSTYKLDVVIIPTNKSIRRDDFEDVVYKTEREKFTAVIKEIEEKTEKGQPVLVGTTSVEKSTAVSRLLDKKGIKHSVLNAKHHENEAFVVAQAGRKGAITVSTNMAGRGTDIILGGNPEMVAKLQFKEAGKDPEDLSEEFEALVQKLKIDFEAEGEEVRAAGGLHIVGTERHESRRIDNQLRGRAGRQGDPGSSRFYLSLEDDLMRIFAGDRVKGLMERMGMPDDEPIEHPWVTKSVQNAQKKVEERNFDIRKNLLEYDDVMNAQRKTVYTLRQGILAGHYAPEIADEDGKPTGKTRVIKPRKQIKEVVASDIGELVAMYLEPQVRVSGDQKPARGDLKDAVKSGAKLVETESLHKDLYARYCVDLPDIEKVDDPLKLYDDLQRLVPQALTEQRERILDLIDQIIAAMVEESCPPNKTPDDWDWGGIFQGYKEHFASDLAEDIVHQADVHALVRTLYQNAEKKFLAKEEELGTEMILRVVRHIYLEQLDKAWVDHLTDMDHLRDGIGLRGYGQKDPKLEYKKEGFNLFKGLLARVSSQVITNLFRAQIRSRAEEEQQEALEVARVAAQLRASAPQHPSVLPPGAGAGTPEEPPIKSQEDCPCGSGKPFADCHGAG